MTGPTLHDRASDAARSILHPQETELRREVMDAQIALARLAVEHRHELEGTGHYDQLSTLLHHAESLEELADTLESTPVQIVPSPRKLWETPESEKSFFDKLSQGTSRFLRQAGDWLRTQGERLEASRLRGEARQLLAEAGAILGGLFTADAAVPAWGAEAVERYQRTLAALTEYQVKVREQSTCQQVEERARALGSQLSDSVNQDNFRSVIDQTGSQLRTNLVEFIAWGVRTCGSFALFAGLLSLTLFVSFPGGALLLSSVLYVWSRYRQDIEAKIDALAQTETSPAG